MIKTHARLLQRRIAFFVWLFILIIWIALELFLLLAFIVTRPDSPSWGIYVVTLIVLGGIIIPFFIRALRRLRAWKRFEETRRAAASGQQALLASPQPTPNADVLPLPSTISNRPPRLPFVVWRLIVPIVLGIVIMTIAVLMTPQPSDPDVSPLVNYLPFLLIILIFFYLGIRIFWPLYVREYRRILITEDGLSVSGLFRRSQFIAWKDIKLLALVALFGNSLYQQRHFQLEVSSANTIVYWPWPQQTISNIPYFNDPSGSSAEYEQQVYKALSVITAKTGLPLYDLRRR